MRTALAAALAPLALLAATPASAQLALELRGGAGAGSYGATAAGFQLVPQPAGSAALSYAFRPGLAAYAGYSLVRFGCDEGFCVGANPTFTSRGLDAGVRVRLPAGLWVRGGAVMHTLEGTGSRGSESADAAFGIGAGAGIGIPLGSRLTLTPGVGYTRYTASTSSGDEPVAIVTADVGLRFSL
ncbi:MAG TPA: outer membrane beta-barrel protein [Longimicrobiaceae bacterium]|nr:outer membrane beta-barrel protein [Longimicrobiaceae bacterium]